MKRNGQVGKQYWLWVTGPDYYFDEDGEERRGLDPEAESDTGVESDTEGWWTCDRRTLQGDLIFLYRTTPKKDIAYLIQATSDAYSIAHDVFAASEGWDYGCEYRVLKKLRNPITIQDLRNDGKMRDWPVLRAQFRGRTWSITPDYWEGLQQLADSKNRGYKETVVTVQRTVGKNIEKEKQLEEALVQDLNILSKFDYDLDLYIDPRTGKLGQQFFCGEGGFIDLLCCDRKKRRYVVIELKNVKADERTIGQISKYIGWVKNNIAKGLPVLGLVISRGSTPAFDLGLHAGAPIKSLDLRKLGFR